MTPRNTSCLPHTASVILNMASQSDTAVSARVRNNSLYPQLSTGAVPLESSPGKGDSLGVVPLD